MRRAQKWNMVWVVPILALLLGIWLLLRHFTAQGPVATVTFETADGIAAMKTEVRCRSVRIGMVKDVKLSPDLKSIVAHLEFDPDAAPLLRKNSRFWVVKPRFSATEFSGVNTLITGAYIELEPGAEYEPPASEFTGLETPPATNRSVPGRRLVLTTEEAGLLIVGAPIYYRGFEVGRIEERALDPKGLNVTYNAFISEAYSHLVTRNTRFWNTSGVDISAGADGLKLRTPSIQALVSGGVAFGVPEGEKPGPAVQDGVTFVLHKDEDAARQSTFNPTMKLLLLFDQTVRGLTRNAPVEFRGIQIGRVAEISFDLMPQGADSRVPVLIEIDPCLMCPVRGRDDGEPDPDFIRKAVDSGLRASLKNSSLLTGSLYVDLNYHADTAPAALGKVGQYTTMPTISGGLAQLEAKLTTILDKLQALPLDTTIQEISTAATEAKTTVAQARETLANIDATAKAATETLNNPQFKALPADLRKNLAELQLAVASIGPNGSVQGDLLRTLDELRASLRSLKSVTETVDDNPNSLLFGRDSSGNPIPRAPR